MVFRLVWCDGPRPERGKGQAACHSCGSRRASVRLLLRREVLRHAACQRCPEHKEAQLGHVAASGARGSVYSWRAPQLIILRAWS